MTPIACKKSVNLMSQLWCDRRRDLQVRNEVVSIITDAKLVRERDLCHFCADRGRASGGRLALPHSRGLRRRGHHRSARDAAVSVPLHRCGAGQPQNQARAQTEVWSAAMSRPMHRVQQRRLSNGQANQRWEDVDDDRSQSTAYGQHWRRPWRRGARPARAEVSEVHLVRQFGIGYLPLTIMLHEKLVEKHAAKAGLLPHDQVVGARQCRADQRRADRRHDPCRLRRHRADGHRLGQDARQRRHQGHRRALRAADLPRRPPSLQERQGVHGPGSDLHGRRRPVDPDDVPADGSSPRRTASPSTRSSIRCSSTCPIPTGWPPCSPASRSRHRSWRRRFNTAPSRRACTRS